ncbi:MAG TPA: lipase family protein, partial [Vicinamibacteria bacterium]|nr:lipase family protein [Vicinamibacteria bacterium]
GHSLGAALATLAATLVRPSGLYTFGSPRVGDEAFVQVADLAQHHRYVGCCDGICDVPPEPLGYRHCGRALFIDRHGAIHEGHSGDQVGREQKAAALEYVLHLNVLAHVAVRHLADHAPLNYSSAVLGVRER